MRHLKTALVCCSVLAMLSSIALAQRPRQNAAAAPVGGQGTMNIGGKQYKIAYVVVYESKVFDQTMVNVLASDTPIPVAELRKILANNDNSDDKFSFFHPNAKVTFGKDGKPAFCNAWADNHSISLSGSSSLTGDLTVKDGRAKGQMQMKYGDDTPPKHSFDISFDAELIAASAAPKKALAKAESDDPAPSKPGNKPSHKAAGKAIGAKELPLPADASNVEYTEIVGQIKYHSGTGVKPLCKWLGEQLKAQGWSSDDDDLITPASAILKRERGDAELTIFVKPQGTGSTVMIMSSGLNW